MANKISTGSYDLNKWLHGGYEKDIITMIAGSPGSGKTNFVLLAACSQAKKGKKVIFIDTEGGFSSERVKQIAGAEVAKEILENILILNCTNFDEQREAFGKLLKSLKNEHVGAVIIDGMAMLYRLELGDAVKAKDDERIKEVNREVARQMRILAEISRKKEIPVLITNQVYSEFVSEDDLRERSGKERKTNIVGGDLFKYWSKCIIELKISSGSVGVGTRRKAILLKHRSLAEREMNFVIRNEGIFRKRIF